MNSIFNLQDLLLNLQDVVVSENFIEAFQDWCPTLLGTTPRL
jgi:hypothetical protein